MIVLQNLLPKKLSFQFKEFSKTCFSSRSFFTKLLNKVQFKIDFKNKVNMLVKNESENESIIYSSNININYEIVDKELIITADIIFGKMIWYLIETSNKKTNPESDLEKLFRNSFYLHNNIKYRVTKTRVENRNTINFNSGSIIEQDDYSKELIKKISKQDYKCNSFYIFYDVETIVNINGDLEPFMICSCVFAGDVFQTKTDINWLSDFQKCCNLESWRWKTFCDKKSFNNLINGSKNVNVFNFCWYLDREILPFLSRKYNIDLKYDEINMYIIGFNNSKFDDNFIVKQFFNLYKKYLIFDKRFSKVTTREFKVGNVTWRFDDIIKFLPDVTLKRACEQYNINNVKIDFDIIKYGKDCVQLSQLIDHCFMKDYCSEPPSFINNCLELVEYYCKRDVLATCELFLKISSALRQVNCDLKNQDVILRHENFFDYISCAQLAFNIFKQFYRRDSPNPRFFKFNHDSQNQFILKSCFGGRVNFAIIGEYESAKKIRYFDVTSEYPLAMTAYYPSASGDVIFNPDIQKLNSTISKIMKLRKDNWDKGELFATDIYENLFWGIFLCDCFPPDDESQLIAFSPCVIKNVGFKNSFSNGVHKNIVINSIHIKTFIFAGWSVEIKPCPHNILFTETEQVFLSFIDNVGKMKTAARHTNKAYAKLLKLFLNSVSGKLAQKPTSDYCIARGTSENLYQYSYSLEDYSSSLHYLSSFVTGHANWILFSAAYKLHKYHFLNKTSLAEKCGLLLYCDTDSIVFDEALTSDDLIADMKIGEEIGRWDQNRQDFEVTWKEKHPGEIKAMTVLARKSYVLYDEHFNLIDTKLKGIHTSQQSRFDRNIINKIVYGEAYTFTFKGLKRSIEKDIALTIMETDIKKSLKREQAFWSISPLSNQDKNINRLFGDIYLFFIVPDYSPNGRNTTQPKKRGGTDAEDTKHSKRRAIN